MALLGKGSDHRGGPDIKNEQGSFNATSDTTSTSSNRPAASSASASTPAPAPADAPTFGTVYKTVGDVPEGDITFALPKTDYRNACYMWQTPNYEVVVPGEPSYRVPINHAMLSACGFLDTDTLEEVIAVSGCSDWNAYVKGRVSGKWLEMQEKILQQAVPVQSTAPAPAPTGWDWADCTGIQGLFIINPAEGASDEVAAAVKATNSVIWTYESGEAKPLTQLIPSLNFLTQADNAVYGPQGETEVNGEWVQQWGFSTPNQIQALVAALGWTDDEAVMQKLYSYFKDNAYPRAKNHYINLEGTILPSAMGSYKASNGTTLSSSNCTITFTLQYALNHSIAKFGY